MIRRKFIDGFTLVELLVVIAIISLLAALLMPALTSSRELARKARCVSQQRQIALANLLFVDDNNGLICPWVDLGPGNCWARTLQPYAPSRNLADVSYYYAAELFYCPTLIRLGSPPMRNGSYGFGGYHSNYSYNSHASGARNADGSSYPGYPPLRYYSEFPNPARIVLLADMLPSSNFASPNLTYVWGSGSDWWVGFVHQGCVNAAALDGHVESLRKAASFSAMPLQWE